MSKMIIYVYVCFYVCVYVYVYVSYIMSHVCILKGERERVAEHKKKKTTTKKKKKNNEIIKKFCPVMRLWRDVLFCGPKI